MVTVCASERAGKADEDGVEDGTEPKAGSRLRDGGREIGATQQFIRWRRAWGDLQLDEEVKCAKARRRRGAWASSGPRGGEATRLGKAPHAPSCPMQPRFAAANQRANLLHPLIGLPVRVTCGVRPSSPSGPPRALASPQIAPSSDSCAPVKFTLLHQLTPVTGALGLQ
jgi:hypothetical protein